MADPFADRNTLDANPFADPSVQGALSSSNRAYDDYDAKSYDAGDDADSGLDTPRGGHVPTLESGAATDSRLQDLQRREAELQARERELQQRAEHIQKHGRNNWPFFMPLIYHDIDAEIPPDSREAMQHIYILWLVLVGTLIVNLVACVFLLIQGSSDGIKDMITGIVYFPVITALSFLLWYRPVYNGFMKNHSLYFYVFFLFAGCHLAFSVYAFLGIPSTGSAGLLNMIQSFASHRLVAAILGVFVTVGFAAQGLGLAWYYKQIWKHNHEQGHTFAQAKAELASHGARAYFTRNSSV